MILVTQVDVFVSRNVLPVLGMVGWGAQFSGSAGLSTTGSWVQFPVQPKLDGCFIHRLVAMVRACPNQPIRCRNTGRKAFQSTHYRPSPVLGIKRVCLVVMPGKMQLSHPLFDVFKTFLVFMSSFFYCCVMILNMLCLYFTFLCVVNCLITEFYEFNFCVCVLFDFSLKAHELNSCFLFLFQ